MRRIVARSLKVGASVGKKIERRERVFESSYTHYWPWRTIALTTAGYMRLSSAPHWEPYPLYSQSHEGALVIGVEAVDKLAHTLHRLAPAPPNCRWLVVS